MVGDEGKLVLDIVRYCQRFQHPLLELDNGGARIPRYDVLPYLVYD